MKVLALRIELHLPQSSSLKSKRAAIRPVIDGVRHRHRLSVAEVAHHDLWQRATIGVAIVSAEVSTATALADDVERFVWSCADLEVIEIERSWLG